MARSSFALVALLATFAVTRPALALDSGNPELDATRARCRRLLDAGQRRNEALHVCREALVQGRSPYDFRFVVSALVLGPELPTPQELGEAAMLAESARKHAASQPWGYAAQFEIARHLGDREMVARSLSDLRRIAPDHEETRRAEALAKTGVSPLWLGFGWSALGLMFAGTAAHAARRRFRSKAGRPALATAGLLAASLSVAPVARAADTGQAQQLAPLPDESKESSFPIDHADPEKDVPPLDQQNARPLAFGRYLMELSAEADLAFKAGNFENALKYYRALSKAVPDRAVSFSRVCQCYERLGKSDLAIESCRDALGRSGATLDDYQRFVGLVMKKPTLSEADVKDLSDVVRHLEQSPESRFAGAVVDCELALRRNDPVRLEVCTGLLEAEAPNDPRTLSHAFAFAMMRGQLDKARGVIERAERNQLPRPALAHMKSALGSAEAVAFRRRAGFIAGTVGLCLFIALGALWLRRRTNTSVLAPS